MNNTYSDFHIPRWSEIPELGLYMEQTVKYINSAFESFAEPFGLAPMTKSMINNYVKARIVDPPENRQYSRISIAMIIVIYFLKSSYSTEDAGKLIQMGIDFNDRELIYNRFCTAVENAVHSVFRGEIHETSKVIDGRTKKYLMGNFALSLACKFYVNSNFIRNHTGNI